MVLEIRIGFGHAEVLEGHPSWREQHKEMVKNKQTCTDTGCHSPSLSFGISCAPEAGVYSLFSVASSGTSVVPGM